MRALITGVNGFVGAYLAELLHEQDIEVFGTTIDENVHMNHVHVFQMDLLQKEAVQRVMDMVKPDSVYHLAAQASVALSWQNPALTFDVNVKGTVNLLESIRTTAIHPKILIIGSSDQYGKPVQCPVSEGDAMHPQSPYAVSKVAQEQLAKLYAQAYGMSVILVRAFNHIGPGQGMNFVASDFACRIAQIEKGAEPVLSVGNLEAYRDFTDVRDIVKGYYLLMQKGRIGEVYNIGSGNAVSIQKILDILLSFSKEKIQVAVAQDKLRPVDIPMIACNNAKIRMDTGWQTTYRMEDTLKDILEYWRRR